MSMKPPKYGQADTLAGFRDTQIGRDPYREGVIEGLEWESAEEHHVEHNACSRSGELDAPSWGFSREVGWLLAGQGKQGAT